MQYTNHQTTPLHTYLTKYRGDDVPKLPLLLVIASPRGRGQALGFAAGTSLVASTSAFDTHAGTAAPPSLLLILALHKWLRS